MGWVYPEDGDHRCIAASSPMPWSTELQLRPPRRRQPGNSLPGGGEPDGLIACPALKRRIRMPEDGIVVRDHQCIAASYPMPWSTELQLRPPRRRQPGNSLPGGGGRDGLIACPALKRRIRMSEKMAIIGVLPHRTRCPGVRSFSSVRRAGGNLAIHCQEEANPMA
jgi:hypothetical protein